MHYYYYTHIHKYHHNFTILITKTFSGLLDERMSDPDFSSPIFTFAFTLYLPPFSDLLSQQLLLKCDYFLTHVLTGSWMSQKLKNTYTNLVLFSSIFNANTILLIYKKKTTFNARFVLNKIMTSSPSSPTTIIIYLYFYNIKAHYKFYITLHSN